MKNTYISKDYYRIMYGLGKFAMVIVAAGFVLVAVSVLVS